MNHRIQDVFHENFPVDSDLIDEIPSRMTIVDSRVFAQLSREAGGDITRHLGYYSLGRDRIFINMSEHRSPSALFSTMFHESLHFVSIKSGAGLNGGFCFPDIGDDAAADKLMDELSEGVRVAVEGVTQNITQAYVLGSMGFDAGPQMFGYDSERKIMSAILEPFSREEKMQIYFKTPMELLRVRIESAFEDDYDVDEPTGVFADCLVDIARANRQMKAALRTWRKNGDTEPIKDISEKVRRAVDYFIVREREAN